MVSYHRCIQKSSKIWFIVLGCRNWWLLRTFPPFGCAQTMWEYGNGTNYRALWYFFHHPSSQGRFIGSDGDQTCVKGFACPSGFAGVGKITRQGCRPAGFVLPDRSRGQVSQEWRAVAQPSPPVRSGQAWLSLYVHKLEASAALNFVFLKFHLTSNKYYCIIRM